ncbi:MAG TPA: AAA family ATPase [Candidatus Nanoarchaeia archaeon]|nr:AAA family ATPase [Candidatus Nanoarchaeia archaeon]
MSTKDKLDQVIYSYTAETNPLEEEVQVLRDTVGRLDQELRRLKAPALMVCETVALLGAQAVIRIPNGNKFLCNVSADCTDIQPGDTVLVEQKNLNVVQKINISHRFSVEKFVIVTKPKDSWDDIGGLEKEVQEVREVIELPLTKPELFKKIGIKPPKGILLHGPPGTGKTLLARAVANSTKSTFIHVAGSELVQKFIGEGAKLVKDIFDLARQKAPSIVFIDELDALAAKRMEIGTSGEREVNRTFMQLLSEIDGFKPLDNVKIIGATNRKDILDSAIMRPGRLDRHIEVNAPSEHGRHDVLKIHARGVNIAKSVDLSRVAKKMEEFTGAEIRAAVTEAGYFAIRANRAQVNADDFEKAMVKVKQHEAEEEVHMFG